MNYRQRNTYSLAAIFVLLFLISHVSSALAQNYTLNSLFSITPGGLPQLTAFAPSINNSGKVAYVRRSNNPSVIEHFIFIHDGTSETAFFNLTTAGIFTNLNVVINDNGAVAALVGATSGTVCPTNVLQCLIRINSDQSVTLLATAGAFGGGTADFGSFEHNIISMNNLGQVAVKVVYNNGTRAIVRIDDSGITEIAQETATLINFTTASINNSGVVAFKATDLSGGCSPSGVCVFSGTGGPLTKEGVEAGGGGAFTPFINNNGLVLAGGFIPLIYTAQGGVVNALVAGNEDPVFSSLIGQPSQNDLGQFVFVSAGNQTGFGMFTGNDPSQDTVFRSNQTVFGGTPGDFRTALHYMNNSGQIAFALAVVDSSGIVTAHIVRADPVPQDTTPPDTSITSSPAAVTNSTSAIFSFTSTKAGSTFGCSLDGSAFTACTNPQSYSNLASGSHTFKVRAIDPAGNTDPTPASYAWSIDSTPPTVSIVTPSNGATYIIGTAVTASYTCSDALSGVASCVGPVPNGSNINTASVGAKSFTVNAQDTLGNSGSATNKYSVAYVSGGICNGGPGHAILQPINTDGTSVFQKGSTVPAKFRVCDGNGVSIGTAGVVSSFKLVQTLSGTTSTSVNEVVDSTTPDTAFRWDATDKLWIYNISTKSLTAGKTYIYNITLNDSSVIAFKFGVK